jgi:hypothetical protein
VSVSTVLIGYCVGAAALALWIVVRFPSLGPKHAAGAVIAAAVAWVGMSVAGPLFGVFAQLGRYGIVLGLLVVVLPALTGAFLACAWTLRMLAGFRPRL